MKTKSKIPRITSGPCNMKFRDWIRTMMLVQIIPFVMAAVRCFQYYHTAVYDKGQDLVLTLGVLCSVHLGFIIVLLRGMKRNSTRLLRIWICYSILETIAFIIIPLVAAIMTFKYTTDIGLGVMMLLSISMFAGFFLYCILTVYSLLLQIIENEARVMFLEVNNPDYQRSQPNIC